jgi:Recombinase
VWKLPVYNTILHILTNPIYAGAYAFGRTGNRVSIEDGRKRIRRGFRKKREDWEVLIQDHHGISELGGLREELARDLG